MAVALDWLAASFADGVFESGHRLLLWSGRARHMEDFFFDDGAVEIVHAVAERDLRKRQSHAHPISSEMIDVIEINTTNRKVAKLLNG